MNQQIVDYINQYESEDIQMPEKEGTSKRTIILGAAAGAIVVVFLLLFFLAPELIGF